MSDPSVAAYVATMPADMILEEYLGLILHECFHCFQKGFRDRADGASGRLPQLPPATVEVDDTRRGERIELGRDARHGGGDDAGDEKAGQAERQFREDEARDDVIHVARGLAGDFLGEGESLPSNDLDVRFACEEGRHRSGR